MLQFRIVILFGALVLAACSVEPGDPPAPQGTVFTGTAAYSSPASDSSSDCSGDCGQSAVIAPGFRATVDKGSGNVATLSAGTGNAVAISNGSVVILNPTVFDGNTAYNFGFQCQAKAGTYKAVLLQTWIQTADYSSAGVSYTETVSGATPAVASEVSGTLTVQSVTSSKLIGTFKGNAKVGGQTRALTAEYNVSVRQQ